MALEFLQDVIFGSDSFTITSGSTGKPKVFITTTGNNDKPSILTFTKDKGAAGSDDDGIGGITFVSDNDAQQQTMFGSILFSVESATDGQEEGKINIGVAALNSGGNNSANVLQGVGNGQNVTDVTIGLGATNVTTIAGTLTMGSTAFVNNSGVIQVATQGTIDHNSLANFDSREHYRWDTDISATAPPINAANIPTLNQSTTGNAATATALTSGNKTISGDLTSNNIFLPGDGIISFDDSLDGSDQYITGTDNALTIVGDNRNNLRATTETRFQTLAGSTYASIKPGGIYTAGDLDLGHESDTTIARASAGKVTIEGNEIQTTNVHHHFLNSGFYLSYPYSRYIPLNGSISEQNVPGSTPEYTGFIWPYDGYVKTIWVRSEANSGNTLMQLYKGTNGSTNGGTAMGSVTEACGAHTSVEFDFTGVTNSFSQGEGMAIKIDPTNTSQGVIVTIECVFNLTT